MKDYMNRAERNELLFLFGFMAQCESTNRGLKNALSDDEKGAIEKAGDIMKDALWMVLTRLGKSNKGLANQLLRESQIAKMQLYIPGSNYMESAPDHIKLDKVLARRLASDTAAQCIGCEGVEECPLRQLRDMLDEPPVNGDSEICAYRIDMDELMLEEFEV